MINDYRVNGRSIANSRNPGIFYKNSRNYTTLEHQKHFAELHRIYKIRACLIEKNHSFLQGQIRETGPQV